MTGRSKSSTYVERHEQKEPDEGTEVCLWSFQCHLDPVPAGSLIFNVDISGPVSIEPHASLRPLFLFVVQKTCCGWCIGHEEVTNDAKQDRACALDYKPSQCHVPSAPTLPTTYPRRSKAIYYTHRPQSAPVPTQANLRRRQTAEQRSKTTQSSIASRSSYKTWPSR